MDARCFNQVMSDVTRHNEWKVVLALAMVAAATLLLASPDSYLHDLYNRVDSAWFYLCGKAWMEGMTPYVDFTDSKGPLLWLIYGVGYLLSPRDYTGVYWLSCLSFTVTLWLIYRAAMVMLHNRRLALFVALLMPLAYFYPHIHEEVKTEHFAQPLIALCLYGTLLLQHGSGLSPSTPRRVMAATGAAMGCALMMKYSFVPMLAVFAVFGLLAARSRGCSVGGSVLWLAVGALAVTLPWAVWMAATGNLDAFVQQYFVNTMGTLGGLREQHGTIVDILRKFRLHHAVTIFPVLCLAGAIWVTIQMKCNQPPAAPPRPTGRTWFPIVATVWFFVCTIPNAWWIYYYEICTWTLFFGFLALTQMLAAHWHPSRLALAGVGAAAAGAAGTWSVALAPANFFTVNHPARDTYYRYVYLMQQVDRPTVMYWDIYSSGFETAAGGLPGTLYWAGQNGATAAMRTEQEAAAMKGDIDFIFVADTLHDAQLRQWGYHPWDYSNRDDIKRCDDLLYTLYTRHTLHGPPPDFAPPEPREIVTKRWKGGWR